jgi:hypothetical protein
VPLLRRILRGVARHGIPAGVPGRRPQLPRQPLPRLPGAAACQYAPPHEWEINPPLTFARIRTRSYEQYAWPAPPAAAFRANGLVAALVTALPASCSSSGS